MPAGSSDDRAVDDQSRRLWRIAEKIRLRRLDAATGGPYFPG
jgi:hypothetical protein